MKSKNKFKQTEISEIPKKWQESRVGDHVELAYGDGLPERDRKKGTIPVFGSNGITGFHDKALVKGPGIIIGRKGTVGQVVFSKTDFWPIDTTYYVKFKGDDDMVFWYYFLSTLGLNQMNSHSAVPGLNRDNVYEITALLPSLPEQRAIAKILSDLDDKIELNHQMNKTLESIAQEIFKRWFVDFEFPNEHNNPHKSSGGKMVDSELGEIPEGWQSEPLGDVLELAYGKGLRDEDRQIGNVPVYGSNGQIGWHDEKLVDGPGIVIGRKGNPGTVIWSHTDFFPIDTTFYVVPKSAIKSMYYIFYLLKSQHLSSLGADSAVPGLNRNIVYMNKIIVPHQKILEVFDRMIKPLFDMIQMNTEEAKSISQIRDSLLPRLMSGKIRVGGINNGRNRTT